jgi:shikimate dehydrogenase
MTFSLSGATRVIPIVGDPIGQVKSPAGVTASLQARGRDAVVIPAHVAPADLDAFMTGLRVMCNVEGLIVTVPHKFAIVAHCRTLTERARFLGAVNTVRRNPDGTWHGDMCDGAGFVQAALSAGCRLLGARVLLVGAGGAGTAIGWSLLDGGAATLAVHDADAGRRDALIERLATRFGDRVQAGSDDPAGFDVVVNASWCGMKADDPHPVQVARLASAMFVGDVITAPAVTPLLQVARDLGCRTQTGGGMFAAVRDLMVEFLLAGTGGTAP